MLVHQSAQLDEQPVRDGVLLLRAVELFHALGGLLHPSEKAQNIQNKNGPDSDVFVFPGSKPVSRRSTSLTFQGDFASQ